eukprot:TRINITY_DN1531_c0_g1_i8.p1 TRINITY_DN1531_c0_g1~~TRINITY_DN1531_c0_g1_i8.p1  ORF type:complete len:451 (-),score=126.83 TRINITY_DN1531_c0_g1_i8:117-1469(-)
MIGSRKRYMNNINHYDHNILGLSNRTAVDASSLIPTTQNNSNGQAVHDMPVREFKPKEPKVMDAHRTSHLDYILSGQTNNVTMSIRKREQRENPAPRATTHTREENGNSISPHAFCANCYNHKVVESKPRAFQRGVRDSEDDLAAEKLKADTSVSKRQEQQKKLLEREMLVKELPSPHDKNSVSPKITGSQDVAEDGYNYEGYGTDYQKIVESSKEEGREKLRRRVVEQIEQSNSTEKERLMNLDTKNGGGNLALPSFNKQKTNKEEYKKSLLSQIEADRDRRIQRRNQEKSDSRVIIQELAKGEYVDKFSQMRAGQKQEYYDSVKEIEKRKQEKRELAEKDKKTMDNVIEKYQKSVKHDKVMKERNRAKWAATLDKQINELNHKIKEEVEMIKEWRAKPDKREESEVKIKRTRKINETSPQNLLVECFSPDLIITEEHSKKCMECSKPL